MVSNFLLAAAFEFGGTILIGIAVLLTHRKIRREHKIDKKVEEEIRHERWVSIVGMISIIIGFIIHVMALANG